MSPAIFRFFTIALFLFAIVPHSPAAEVTADQVKAAITELESLTQQTMKKTGVPGVAIAIVHNDQVVYLKGFGVRQVGKAEAVDADTIFQLASVSKPVTSTVMAALVGEKIVDWDDPIVNHDPGFALYTPWVTSQVTLRDFLCHRSGLPDHGGDLLEDLGYDRKDVLHRLRFLKPASSFRSQYAYTNFGFSEAAVAAAKAAGKPWEEVAAEKLYRPLGMASTSSRYEDYAAAKNRALIHARIDGKWTAKYNRNADAQAPAGGVSSSVRDMAQWLRLQLGGGKVDGKQIVADDALDQTHTPQFVSRPRENPESERAGFYGLGWNVNYDDHGRARLGHSGGFDLGAATAVNLVPSEKLGIVVLSNASPIGVPEALAASFNDLALSGKVQRDWPTIFGHAFEELSKPNYGLAVDYKKPPVEPTPALANSAYTGHYANDCYGDLEIAEKQGALSLRIGPKPLVFDLRHFNRDVFLYQPTGEMSGGPSAVTFTIGPDGKALQVTFENLDVDGQGTFTRSAKPRP
jgi:CubicO group peptidase (beta-lactamase class C family)